MWGADAAPDTRPIEDRDDAGDATPDQDASSLDGLGDDAPASDAGTGADGVLEGGAPDARGDTGNDARADSTVIDARADVASIDAADAADSGAVRPICEVPYPACVHAIEVDAQVRAAFPGPCSPQYQRMCAGMPTAPVETLPVLCYEGLWRLSGGMSGTQWVAGHNCSMGCQSGKLCNP